MFASLLEAARNSPFHGPLTPALCESPALTEVEPAQVWLFEYPKDRLKTCLELIKLW